MVASADISIDTEGTIWYTGVMRDSNGKVNKVGKNV